MMRRTQRYLPAVAAGALLISGELPGQECAPSRWSGQARIEGVQMIVNPVAIW